MMSPDATGSRERVLARIRAALADAPPAPDPVRAYREAHAPDDPEALVELLAENLTDYRAHVHRATAAELPARVAGLLAERGSRSVVAPDGLPGEWLAEVPGPVRLVRDTPPLTPGALDGIDSVVTGCALAIAETGTVVLDAGPGQGRRALTLVPDHHICVVRTDQVVASVPLALRRLVPESERPQTWVSGPSATSDIELDRVEGVHGPRTLDVILLTA